jgi:queuosine precursor transporter
MASEVAFLALVLIELIAISAIAQAGREWLYGSIIVNLLLVSTLGAKTVAIFGFVTNSGNIFYAAAVFATLLLVEIYGVNSARWSVGFSVALITFFLIATRLVIDMPGLSDNETVNQALREVFTFVPRVALASIIALAVSQNVAIAVYERLKEKYSHRLVWMRNLASVMASQLIDSLLFFSIAFLGVISTGELVQFMLAGFVIKVLFGLASTPFLLAHRTVILSKDPATTP